MVGKVAPAIVNPVPVSVAEFMVIGPVPEEVSVSTLVDAVFSVTLPKARALVLSVNCGVAGALPVPLRETVVVLLLPEALLYIEIVPLARPAEVGSKLTWRVID